MSGIEALGILGGIGASVGLLKNAQDIIAWIRSGSSGEQLSREISEVELCFELFVDLHKLNVNLKASGSKALRNIMNEIYCQLHALQEMKRFEESLQHAKKRVRVRHSLKQPARTKKLRDCLITLKRSLELVYITLHTRYAFLTLESPPSDELNTTKIATNAALDAETASSSLCTQASKSELIPSRSTFGYYRRSKHSACNRGTCTCFCHHTNNDIYHRNWLHGSSLASLFIKCSCNTKAFSWTMTAFRRQVSLIVSLTYNECFILSPSLRICNTVPNTAPIFVVLYKCRMGYMQFDEALSAIRRITDSREGSLDDINRDGYSFFEELLCYPWDLSSRHTQFALLDHFMAEGHSIDSEKLLLLAVSWIGEGPHMELLETILPRNGGPLMEPAEAHAVLFQNWPASFDCNWICRSITRDPFFIEALSLFVNHGPDFGDTGPLQYEIHSGCLDSTSGLLHRKNITLLAKEKNFLQQSALHISVHKPKTLELLLSYGFAEIIDDGDRDGTTALMYAAAYGETRSAITLLRAGADPMVYNDRKELYLVHALERGHFGLIEGIVNFYNTEGDPEMAQLTLDAALHCYVWQGRMLTDPILAGLQRLLELGARPKWVTGKGNSLLHAVNSADMASLLLEYCSPSVTHQNAIGYTPLMLLSWFLDVDLLRKALSLSAGVPIHERDHSGWTIFEHLFRANSSRCISSFCTRQCDAVKWVPTFQIAFDLLQAGVDFGTSDHCTCNCSSKGCTALRFFLPSIHYWGGRRHNLRGIPWIIEHFLLLRCLHKTGLQILIKSLFRRQRFDEIGLTHTCCLKLERFSPLSRYFSPYAQAREDERSEEDHDPPINADHKELEEEQEELVRTLDRYCQEFERQEELTPEDCESALITTLARRTVFFERGMAQAASRANEQHHLALQKSSQSFTKVYSDKVEILRPPPREDVIDYGKDEFICTFNVSILRDYNFIPCMEDLVNDYLESTKKLHYPGLPLPANHEDQGLHKERDRLCRKLIEEIRAVREISEDEADWTLDIVGGE